MIPARAKPIGPGLCCVAAGLSSGARDRVNSECVLNCPARGETGAPADRRPMGADGGGTIAPVPASAAPGAAAATSHPRWPPREPSDDDNVYSWRRRVARPSPPSQPCGPAGSRWWPTILSFYRGVILFVLCMGTCVCLLHTCTASLRGAKIRSPARCRGPGPHKHTTTTHGTNTPPSSHLVYASSTVACNLVEEILKMNLSRARRAAVCTISVARWADFDDVGGRCEPPTTWWRPGKRAPPGPRARADRAACRPGLGTSHEQACKRTVRYRRHQDDGAARGPARRWRRAPKMTE
jgi:hypothetical protein